MNKAYKYLIEIDKKHYTVSLVPHENTTFIYDDCKKCELRAHTPIEMPTADKTGSGFVAITFPNGNNVEDIHTIAKLPKR